MAGCDCKEQLGIGHFSFCSEGKDQRIAELEAAALLVVQTSGNWKLENQHADAVLKLKALLGGEG